MTFTAEQTAELRAPLNKAHVKPPAPGKYGDYIEGWRVIDEANRIFGFDGWTRDTVEMIETNRDLKGDKWHVGYRAKVRITAGGIFRDGTGFGSGVSKQLGDAVESAVKEAETDAMKRALMTFGNPFGLALYDKTQANVQEAPPALIDDAQWAELTTLMQATGADAQAFCTYYKIPSLKELPASRFDHARAMLNKKKAA